jgi:hypothetical protein
MTVLRHMGVISLAKISALMGLVWGFLYGIFLAVFAAALASLPGLEGIGMMTAGTFGAMLIVIMVIMGAVMGFIVGAIAAFLYNFFAASVGGIEIQLS